MEPNIENLYVGQQFKSFKALVEFVGLTYRNGGYPCQLHKNKLHKYIEWQHDIDPITGRKKHSLVITKIY